MNTLDPIQLNREWLCYPLLEMNSAYSASDSDDSTWEVLVRLEDWPRDLVARAGVVVLHRRFDLEPIGETCLRFILHVEDAPDGTNIILNDRQLGAFYGGDRFEKDVTDCLTLEDNVLRFEVSKVGPFSGVLLRRVPCETRDATH